MEFLHRLFHIWSEYDCMDEFWCRKTQSRDAQIHESCNYYDHTSFYVNCNDTFEWACSEGEEVTPENIQILEEAMKDCDAVLSHGGYIYGTMLFAARVRKCRPQNAVYPQSQPGVCVLLDQAGPEREVNASNPRPHWTVK